MHLPLELTPLVNLTTTRHHIPIHPHPHPSHPLLIYHSCIPPSTPPFLIESHLKSLNIVTPHWRYTMYTHPHFHSSTHEVLCIFSGSARLCFSTPIHTAASSKIQTTVKSGDVIIIPAGISHHLLEDLTGDFQMIGSYPNGKTWDMCYGDGSSEEEEKVRGIADLEWFDRDPLYGDQGPVLGES